MLPRTYPRDNLVTPPQSELSAEHILFIAAVMLACGSVLGFIAKRLRVPDLVLFLLAGIGLGPHGLGVLDIPAGSSLSWIILIFGASYILFDGGATLRLGVLSRIWISLIVIVTLGLLLTAFLTGLAAHWVLGIPVVVGMLFGSTVASTDPATLVPVLKQIKVREKVSQMVVSESAFNDPVGAIVTLAFLGIVVGGHGGNYVPIGTDTWDLLMQIGIGIGAGAILGYLAALVVAHERFGFLLEYLPMVTLIVVIGSYLGASGLNASGFMAAFVSGIVLGNMGHLGLKFPVGTESRFGEFVETTSLISRMFIFLLLGSQVKLDLIRVYWWQGLVVVAVLMFVARPLAVLISAGFDRRARWSWKELAFIAWTRETGVIPGALASILVAERAPYANVIAAMTFMTILITIITQATTAKWAAKRLDLLAQG